MMRKTIGVVAVALLAVIPFGQEPENVQANLDCVQDLSTAERLAEVVFVSGFGQERVATQTANTR